MTGASSVGATAIVALALLSNLCGAPPPDQAVDTAPGMGARDLPSQPTVTAVSCDEQIPQYQKAESALEYDHALDRVLDRGCEGLQYAVEHPASDYHFRLTLGARFDSASRATCRSFTDPEADDPAVEMACRLPDGTWDMVDCDVEQGNTQAERQAAYDQCREEQLEQ
jgi:hypothetical protein